MPPLLSIIVPHLNQPELLTLFLRSLHDQFDMSRVEVIVVDNGSRRMPEAEVAPWPAVRLVHEPTPGPGPARNRGVALSSAPIIAFTDSDVLLAPDWMPKLLARFEDPATKIIGGEVRVFARDPAHPTAAEAYEAIYAFPQETYILQKGFSVSANLAMRREIFDEVGPFVGIHVAEDTEWGQRATAMGHETLYAPEVKVFHPARRTMADLYRTWDRNVSHQYTAFVEGAAGKAKWVMKAGALVLSPIANIPRIARTDRLNGVTPRLLAFQALCALRFYRARKMIAAMGHHDTKTASVRWNRQ